MTSNTAVGLEFGCTFEMTVEKQSNNTWDITCTWSWDAVENTSYYGVCHNIAFQEEEPWPLVTGTLTFPPNTSATIEHTGLSWSEACEIVQDYNGSYFAIAFLESETKVFSTPSEPPDVPLAMCWYKGDPISLADGSLRVDEIDCAFPSPGGGIAFSRTYRTRQAQYASGGECEESCNANRRVGKGWQFSWDTRLTFWATHVRFITPAGEEQIFWKNGLSYLTNPRYHDTLASYDDNGTTKYTVTTPEKTVFWFDEDGKIEQITDSWERATSFSYNASDRLIAVTDTAGRQYNLDYNANGNIAHVYMEESDDDPPSWDTGDRTLVTFTYDLINVDVLWKATNAAGEVIEYTYDENYGAYPYMTRRTTHEDRCSYYVFDESDERYTEVFYSNASYTGAPDDPVLQRLQFTTDYVPGDNHDVLQRVRVRDQNAHTTTYLFHSTCGFDRIEYADGTYVEYAYDEDGNCVERLIVGHEAYEGYFLKTVNTWDENSNLVTTATRRVASKTASITAVDVTFSYDESAFPRAVTAVSDALDRTTYNDYDDTTGALLKTYRLDAALNEVNVTEYDYFPAESGAKSGLLQSVTDSQDHVTAFDYDAQGNLTRVDRELLPDITFTYNEATAIGVPLTRTVAGTHGSRHTLFTYDALNRVLSVEHPPAEPNGDAFSEHFAYRSSGDLDSVTRRIDDVTFVCTEFTYDDVGLMTAVTSQPDTADEAVVQYGYDDMGSLTRLVDAGGRRMDFTYSPTAQLETITYYEDGVDDHREAYAYYPDGSLCQWTTCAGEAYTYGYDDRNLLWTICHDGDPLVTYSTYDNGLVHTITNNAGTVTYTYDTFNRIASIDGALSGTVDRVTYTYSPNNLVAQLGYERDGETATIGWSRNALNQITELSYDDEWLTTWTYDATTGCCTTRVLPNGVRTDCAYDDLDRLIALTTRRSTGELIERLTAHYNAHGLRDTTTTLDGRTTEYAYDGLLRLTSEVQHTADNETIYDFAHTLDASGNCTARCYDDNTSTTLSLTTNALNQLTAYSGTRGNRITVTGLLPSDWTLETLAVTPNGNTAQRVEAVIRGRLFAAYGVELQDSANNSLAATADGPTKAGNTVTPATVSNVAFDQTPNVTFEYDDAGNRTAQDDAAGETTYTYDFMNRLVAIEYPDGSRTTCTYDALGRRIREEEWSTAEVKLSERQFVYDGFDVILELDGSNEPLVEYVYGGSAPRSIAGPLFARTNNEFLYYTCNTHGDVVAVTDEEENLVAFYDYSADGRLLTEATSVPNTLLYSGKRRHAKSGLYDFGYRWYDPTTARWMTRDPLNVLGGLNLYQYASANPVELVDPYGLCSESTTQATLLAFGDGLTGNHISNTALVAELWGPRDAILYAVGKPTGAIGISEGVYGVDYVSGEPIDGVERTSRGLIGGGEFLLTAAGVFDALGINYTFGGTAAGSTLSSEAAVREGMIPASAYGKSWSTQRRHYWQNQLQQNPSRFTAANQQRIQSGLAPLGSDGYPMELHHVNRATQPYRVQEMTRTEHRLGNNFIQNHPN